MFSAFPSFKISGNIRLHSMYALCDMFSAFPSFKISGDIRLHSMYALCDMFSAFPSFKISCLCILCVIGLGLLYFQGSCRYAKENEKPPFEL